MNWISNFFNRHQGSTWTRLRFLNASPQFNTYGEDAKKLEIVFRNPALLKIISLQCDLFSLAEVYVYKDGEEQKNDPLLKLLKNPNPFQSKRQLLWDYMFWNMIGNDYMFINKKEITNPTNKIYLLNPGMLEFPQSIVKRQDKLILSASAEKEILDTVLKYKYEDGTHIDVRMDQLIIVNDLTNGTGNWFKGNSRIDALHKIINNSEKALDSKGVNLEYSKRFTVSGKHDPKDVSTMPFTPEEKLSVEDQIRGTDDVLAVKSVIDIKRFVDNMGAQKLDESYLASYYLIGNMYNIPRDVLEAYQSGTFENQEKARASHVSYTCEPKGLDLTDKLGSFFKYEDDNKTIVLSWDHLPFNQVFEKDRATKDKTKVETFNLLRKGNVTLEDANKFLDTTFTEENTKENGNQQTEQTAS